MTTLFVVTSLSQNMLDAIIAERSKGDIVIITPNRDFYESYRVPFPDIIFIGADAEHDGKKDNKRFADQFMPGVLDNLKIPNSDLEVWKALSIDRLRFWYRGNSHKHRELIESIDWNLCYTSLDMGSTLPMQAMWIARERTLMKKESKSIAVKTEPIRTPEVLDLAPLFTFDGYIVDTEGEALFLRNSGVKKDARIMITKRGIAMRREPQLRDALRKSMDVVAENQILGVLLDKRDEWQAASFLNELNQDLLYYNSLIIVPVDDRSKELAYKIVPRNMIGYIAPYSMLDACDEIVAFRWDDHYCFNLPAKLNIIDYKGVNRARELAPYDIVVGIK